MADETIIWELQLDDSQMQQILNTITESFELVAGKIEKALGTIEAAGISTFAAIQQSASKVGKAIDVSAVDKSMADLSDKVMDVDAAIISLISKEIQLLATTQDLDTEFLALATGASETIESYKQLLSATVGLTGTQRALAQAAAQTVEKIEEAIRAFKNTQNAEAAVEQIKAYITSLRELRAQLEADVAGETDFSNAAKEAKELEEAYRQLVAVELAKYLDETAQGTLATLAATGRSAEEMLTFARNTGQATEAQIEFARRAADLQNATKLSGDILDTDDLQENIQELDMELRELRFNQQLITDSDALADKITKTGESLETLKQVDAYDSLIDQLEKYALFLGTVDKEQQQFIEQVVRGARETALEARTDITVAAQLEEERQAAERLAETYRQLVAVELSQYLDETAQSTLQNLVATDKTAEELLEFARNTGQATEAQIRLAQQAATTRAALTQQREGLAATEVGGLDVTALDEKIRAVRFDQELIGNAEQLVAETRQVGENLNSIKDVQAFEGLIDSLREYSSRLDSVDADTKALVDRNIADFERLAAVQRNAITQRGIKQERDTTLQQAIAETEKQDKALIKLIATELRLAAAGEQTTQVLIDQAQRGAQSTRDFITAVQAGEAATGGLSQAQIQVAIRTAEAKQQLELLTAELNQVTTRSDFNSLIQQITVVAARLKEAQDASERLASFAELADEIQKLGGSIDTIEDLEALEGLITQLESLRDSLVDTGEISEDAFNKIANEAKQAAQEARQAYDQLSSTDRDPGQQFNTLLRLFPSVRKRLGELVNEYGDFTAVVGRTTGPLSTQQRQFNAIINSNSALSGALKKLVGEYGNFNVEINKSNTLLGKQGKSLSSLALGTTIGLVSELTRSFIQLAKEGIRAAIDELEKLLKVTVEFDTFEALFTGIFDSAEIGTGVLKKLRGESERLGFTAEKAYSRLLPLVGDFELAKVAAESISGLQLLAPDLPSDRIIGSLVEIVSGDLRTLSRTFEVAEEPFRKAVAKFMEQGYTEAQAGVLALEETLQRYGLNFANLEGTLKIQTGRLQQQFKTLQATFGEPFGESLAEALQVVNNFLSENKEELQLLAGAAGIALGTIVEAFSDLVLGLDDGDVQTLIQDITQGIKDFTDEVIVLEGTLQKIGVALGVYTEDLGITDKILNGILGTLADLANVEFEPGENKSQSLVGFFSGLIDSTNELIKRGDILGDIFGETGTKISRVLSAIIRLGSDLLIVLLDLFSPITDLGTVAEESGDRIKNAIGGVFEDLTADVAGFFAGVGKGLELLDDLAERKITFDEFVDSIEAASKAAEIDTKLKFDTIDTETTEALEEADEKFEDLEESIAATGDEALEAAEGYLALQAASDDLAVAQQNLADAQAKVAEQIAENARKLAFDLEEAEIDRVRKLVDLETELSQKRQDIYTDWVRKIQEASRDLADEQADITRDLLRDEEDALIKAGQEEEDLEIDKARKLIDIEEKLQERLAEIRRRADFDAQEAIRQNDAVALRRIRRRMEFDLNEALLERDDAEQDLEKDIARTVEDLNKQYERDVENARRAADRKRQDAITEHSRTLREIFIQRMQDEEDLKTHEERKREEIQLAYERRLEDLIKANQFRMEELLKGLEDEKQAVADAHKEMTRVIAEQIADANQAWKDGVAEARENAANYYQGIIDETIKYVERMARIIGGAGLPFSGDGGGGPGDLPDREPGYGGGGTGDEPEFYATGGSFRANRPLIVGDSLNNRPNPEVVSFNRPGQVTPLSDILNTHLTRNMAASGPMPTVVNYTTNINASVVMHDPNSLTRRQRELMRKEAVNVFIEAQRGIRNKV